MDIKKGEGFVTMHEIFEKGNLIKIEVWDSNNEFVFDIMWNPMDEQTHENREEFRKWSVTVIKRYGYKKHVSY